MGSKIADGSRDYCYGYVCCCHFDLNRGWCSLRVCLLRLLLIISLFGMHFSVIFAFYLDLQLFEFDYLSNLIRNNDDSTRIPIFSLCYASVDRSDSIKFAIDCRVPWQNRNTYDIIAFDLHLEGRSL